MTTEEAAEYIGESIRTLEGWRRSGKGPKFFLNAQNRPRYKRSVLDEYMDSREVDPAESFDLDKVDRGPEKDPAA
jgi:predicted site-specific integrase-resolvase